MRDGSVPPDEVTSAPNAFQKRRKSSDVVHPDQMDSVPNDWAMLPFVMACLVFEMRCDSVRSPEMAPVSEAQQVRRESSDLLHPDQMVSVPNDWAMLAVVMACPCLRCAASRWTS
jgi:hypothetical protein